MNIFLAIYVLLYATAIRPATAIHFWYDFTPPQAFVYAAIQLKICFLDLPKNSKSLKANTVVFLLIWLNINYANQSLCHLFSNKELHDHNSLHFYGYSIKTSERALNLKYNKGCLIYKYTWKSIYIYTYVSFMFYQN